MVRRSFGLLYPGKLFVVKDQFTERADGVYHSTCPGGVNIVTALPASDQKKLSGEDAMAFSL